MDEFSLFHASSQPILAATADGILCYVNPAALQLLGYDASELLGQPLSGLILDHCGDWNLSDLFVHLCPNRTLTLRTHAGIGLELGFNVLEGSQQGLPVRLLSLHTLENSQRRENECHLIKMMLDSVSDFIYIKDPNGVHLSCNHAFAERFVGMPKQEVLGKTVFELIQYPHTARRCTEMDQFVLEHKQTCSYEEPVMLADGTEIVLDTLKVPYFDDEGNVQAIIGISRDVTPRKQLENILDNENRKIRLLYELYNKASKHERLDEFIDFIQNMIIDLYQIDGILFYLYSESRGRMLLFSCYGISKNLWGMLSTVDLEEGVLGWQFGSHACLQKPLDSCAESCIRDAAQAEGFRYFDASSITFQDSLLGALVLFHRKPQTSRDMSFFPYACDALSVVINNFTLAEKQRRDYSELIRLQNQLLQAKVKAETENQSKSDFLATMSHEIRTPLSGIIGFLDLLSQSELPEPQSIYVKNAGTASHSLLALINDILDVSKIESGNFVLENIPFPLVETIKGALMFHMPMANKKGIYLRLHADANLPLYVSGDPMRLKEILNNFLSNGIKFTSSGGITLSVDVTAADAAGVTLAFQVCDTGVGIAEENLANLFRPYTQAESSTSREYGGTGLGLVICKELIERMGGTVSVESTPGSGTRFAFSIGFDPVDEAAATRLSAAHPPRTDRPPEDIVRGIRILLAEDNEINRQLIIFSLKNAGMQCDIACNGMEAVRLAVKTDYHIIFMDCQMPQMDGYEATAQIRQADAQSGKHSVIIAMTANSMLGERKKCIDAGMDDYISKPIDFATMFELIGKYYHGADTPESGDGHG